MTTAEICYLVFIGILFIDNLIRTMRFLSWANRWKHLPGDPSPPPQVDMTNPYLFLYVINRHTRLIRLAMWRVSCLGLVEFTKKGVFVRNQDAVVADPIERSIYQWACKHDKQRSDGWATETFFETFNLLAPLAAALNLREEKHYENQLADIEKKLQKHFILIDLLTFVAGVIGAIIASAVWTFPSLADVCVIILFMFFMTFGFKYITTHIFAPRMCFSRDISHKFDSSIISKWLKEYLSELEQGTKQPSDFRTLLLFAAVEGIPQLSDRLLRMRALLPSDPAAQCNIEPWDDTWDDLVWEDVNDYLVNPRDRY